MMDCALTSRSNAASDNGRVPSGDQRGNEFEGVTSASNHVICRRTIVVNICRVGRNKWKPGGSLVSL